MWSLEVGWSYKSEHKGETHKQKRLNPSTHDITKPDCGTLDMKRPKVFKHRVMKCVRSANLPLKVQTSASAAKRLFMTLRMALGECSMQTRWNGFKWGGGEWKPGMKVYA